MLSIDVEGHVQVVQIIEPLAGERACVTCLQVVQVWSAEFRMSSPSRPAPLDVKRAQPVAGVQLP